MKHKEVCTMNTLDARGLSCPQPVMLLRNAMETEEPAYEVLVDNPASMENVTRYAQHRGYRVSVTQADGEYTLHISK